MVKVQPRRMREYLGDLERLGTEPPSGKGQLHGTVRDTDVCRHSLGLQIVKDVGTHAAPLLASHTRYGTVNSCVRIASATQPGTLLASMSLTSLCPARWSAPYRPASPVGNQHRTLCGADVPQHAQQGRQGAPGIQCLPTLGNGAVGADYPAQVDGGSLRFLHKVPQTLAEEGKGVFRVVHAGVPHGLIQAPRSLPERQARGLTVYGVPVRLADFLLASAGHLPDSIAALTDSSMDWARARSGKS